jgi:hypothetical protein
LSWRPEPHKIPQTGVKWLILSGFSVGASFVFDLKPALFASRTSQIFDLELTSPRIGGNGFPL